MSAKAARRKMAQAARRGGCGRSTRSMLKGDTARGRATALLQLLKRRKRKRVVRRKKRDVGDRVDLERARGGRAARPPGRPTASSRSLALRRRPPLPASAYSAPARAPWWTSLSPLSRPPAFRPARPLRPPASSSTLAVGANSPAVSPSFTAFDTRISTSRTFSTFSTALAANSSPLPPPTTSSPSDRCTLACRNRPRPTSFDLRVLECTPTLSRVSAHILRASHPHCRSLGRSKRNLGRSRASGVCTMSMAREGPLEPASRAQRRKLSSRAPPAASAHRGTSRRRC